jgi:O-acetylserine/cysteine efflux transporter
VSTAPGFSQRELGLALGIVVIWGLNFVVMKFGLREFTPFQLAAARFAIASLPFIVFIAKPELPWRFVLGYGLLQGVGQFGFLFTALHVGMTASLASVLMQTQVFFTAAIGMATIGERLHRHQVLALGLAALGLMCFAIELVATTSTNTSTSVQLDAKNGIAALPVSLAGLVLTLCAAASWAASNVVARKAQSVNPGFVPLQFVVWTSVVPVFPMLAMSLCFDPPGSQARWLQAGVQGWGAAAYLGLVATVWAYAMWTGLLKRHAANKVSPFGLGVPVVGLTAGMLVLGERISAWQWAGIGCVAAALVATTLGARWFANPPKPR